MVNKAQYTLLIVFGLSALFLLISFLLFLSGNRSAWFTSKKIRLDAASIALTAASNSFQSCIRTCYVPASDGVPTWTCDDTVNLNEDKFLTLFMSREELGPGSYKISDSTEEMINAENFVGIDGDFDDYSEECHVELDSNLAVGQYNIQIYMCDTSEQTSGNYIKKVYFQVIRD